MNKTTKIIFLDLDGTLLTSEKTISKYTLSVLEECKRKGILLVFATARSEASSKRFVKIVKPNGLISNGGSLVRFGDEIIHKCTLDKITSDALIIELLTRPELRMLTVETDTGYYISHIGNYSSDYGHAVYYDFATPLFQDTYKVTIDVATHKVVQEIANKFPNVSVTPFSGETWYRLAHIESSKKNAAQKVIDFLGLNVAQTTAFGDDYNDIEILKLCGIGVAMGHAADRVKAISDYICEINDNDGVAKWLEKYVL
ncbi:MAG: HAD family phosphatase [Clostridiales bacterium]|nr:HAD family phosphatase [Clostridiales bacterium]